MIDYRSGDTLDIDQFIELYRSSKLGERRPLDDRERLTTMLRNANLVITAWDGDLLVGLSRCLTDFAHFTYLADLAVRVSHQRRGIGRELMRRTQELSGPNTSILLLAAPGAQAYYPHTGFTYAQNAWILKPGEKVS